MKGMKNEYEVTIRPDGAWSIRYICGEQSTQVAHGHVEERANVMGRAEEAAERWLDERKRKEAELKKRAEGSKVYTVKA